MGHTTCREWVEALLRLERDKSLTRILLSVEPGLERILQNIMQAAYNNSTPTRIDLDCP